MVMVSKKRDLAARFDRLICSSPWWILAMEASGLVPGYIWWLITGDAEAARHIIRIWLPCPLAALLFFCGLLGFYLPFYRPVEKPSAGQRAGYAVLGGLLWAVAVFAVTGGTLGLSILAAARAGTAVFAVGVITGFVIQQRLAAG